MEYIWISFIYVLLAWVGMLYFMASFLQVIQSIEGVVLNVIGLILQPQVNG